VTEKQYLREKARKERLWELIDGTLVSKVTSLAWGMHSIDLMMPVVEYIQAHDLGLAAMYGPIRILPNVIRAPSFSFLSRKQVGKDRHWRVPVPPLAPVFAFDARHEGNTAKELARRRNEYFEGGTRLLWEVDPVARTVDVYTSPEDVVICTDTDVLDGGDVFPGLRIDLGELFTRRESRWKGK
jgi:hypothetical protein